MNFPYEGKLNSTPQTKRERRVAALLSKSGLIGAIVALTVSMGTLAINALQWRDASLKAKLDRWAEENDRFFKLISEINNKDTPPRERMTFLWSLRPYWNTEKAETVANALAAIILYDDDEKVIEVCPDVLDGAYRYVKNRDQKTQIKKLLYGEATGEIGIIQRTQQILLEPKFPRDSLYETRLTATKNAVRRNWDDLTNVNLKNMDMSTCELYGADLSRSDLTNTILVKANLYNADLTGTKIDCATIDGANLKCVRGTPTGKWGKGTPVRKNLREWRQSVGIDPSTFCDTEATETCPPP